MIDQWYEQYSAEITRFICSKGFSPEDADDLCAQVFLEAVECQPADTAPRAWLYLVARNRMIDAWRRAGRRPVEVFGELDVVADGDIEMQAVTDDEKAQLRMLIGQLAPSHQQVLALRFAEEMSLQDTATALSTTVSAVKARQGRALAALKLKRPTEPPRAEARPQPEPIPEPEPADTSHLDNRAELLARCLRLEMENHELRNGRGLNEVGVQ